MIKHVRILAMAMAFNIAHAMTPQDLKGGEVFARGQCLFSGQLQVCLFVKKDDETYVVVMGRVPLAIYKVKELKSEYTLDEMQLMWSKDSV